MTTKVTEPPLQLRSSLGHLGLKRQATDLPVTPGLACEHTLHHHLPHTQDGEQYSCWFIFKDLTGTDTCQCYISSGSFVYGEFLGIFFDTFLSSKHFIFAKHLPP